MNHAELNLVLQECPESPYFARDDWRTNEEEARKLVLGFVEQSSFGSQGPLIEANPSKESSNKSDSKESKELSSNKSDEPRGGRIIQELQSLDDAAQPVP